ncbi:MAG: hypothetical protein BWX88_01566 [Planctomycetes bacterium ADurb.Bin126]|nr:MAG: hypothetical protein BWX88_01566 [Planctomycetes bacterium ADurb.Bin126]HOD80401.1 hypothetical protein [Phycisphaerae bacterium]HQL74432.1 hypothetical protein [Phycisphaerae bacterium]
MNRKWNGNRLAIGGLGLMMMGSLLLVVWLLLEIAHIIGGALVLVGLGMVLASIFMRKG